MTTYCDFCNALPPDDIQRVYHDTQYGFPLREDNLLFERLVLEINQAGLSWLTILKKAEGFRRAYAEFDLETVAGFGEADRLRLLSGPGIIRNRLKINAAIENARRIRVLQGEFGSFRAWLDAHAPQEKDAWVILFKRTFVFTGGEIVGEFLMSTGYLPGAHSPLCPLFEKIESQKRP